MRSTPRTSIRYWLTAVLPAIAPLLAATDVQASVLPPPNDDIHTATTVTGMPFRDAADLSQATWDSLIDDSPCNGTSHSVWYSFTPATSEKIAFDPSPSNTVINIDVFTGSPGDLTFAGCGQGGSSGFFNSGYVLHATAGTTYWIMASTFCCPPQPNLDLSVYPALAPQAALTVNGATVDQGGNATVTGTLDCVGTVPIPAAMSGSVRQSVGRLSSVSAGFATTSHCAAALHWTALAQPSTGRFTGGPATVNASASICNIVGCATSSTTTVVKLRR